nr:MAG TPA: hypothetical protein [Caudoviricetes sp.]
MISKWIRKDKKGTDGVAESQRYIQHASRKSKAVRIKKAHEENHQQAPAPRK